MLVFVSSLSVLAALLSIVVPIWCAHRTRHHVAAQVDTEMAYKAAAKLIKDDRTPREVVVFVRAFAELMKSPKVSRALVWDVITGKFWRSNQAQGAKKEGLFDGLAPEALEEVNRFLVHVLLASASRDPVFAWLTRRIILFGLTGQDESDVRDSRAVIIDLSRQFRAQVRSNLVPVKA